MHSIAINLILYQDYPSCQKKFTFEFFLFPIYFISSFIWRAFLVTLSMAYFFQETLHKNIRVITNILPVQA